MFGVPKYTINTHTSNQFREKRKRKKQKKATQASDQKPNKSQGKIT
jgi:hypothetical protein